MFASRSSPQIPSRSLVSALLLSFLWLARCRRERWEAPRPAVVKGFCPSAASVWYLILFGPASLLLPAPVRGQQTLGRAKDFQERASDRTLLRNSQTPILSPHSTPSNSSGDIHVFPHIFRRPEPEMKARADDIIREQQAALRESGGRESGGASAPANSSGEIHVFYHIFEPSKGKARGRAGRIIREQQAALRSSGVEQAAAAVHYTAIGKHWEELVLEPASVYWKTNASGGKGSEGVTLQLVWEHCARAPQDRVLYIHSKGSFHSLGGLNDRFRKALMYSVLHPCCLEAISGREVGGQEGLDGQKRSSEGTGIGGHDVCGMRYSPIPYVAFHGNMWWARCDYIRRLIPPLQFRYVAMENVAKTVYHRDPCCLKYKPSHHGLRRFAFEHWVGSHPSLRAVDNLPGAGLSPHNSTFLDRYSNVPVTSGHRWKPVCSRAPRAEIPLATYLVHPHFFFSPLPSRQWEEYTSLYGNASSSAMEHKRKESAVPSICMWWERLASLQHNAQQWAVLSEFEKAHVGLQVFLTDWLRDYTIQGLQERCPDGPWL